MNRIDRKNWWKVEEGKWRVRFNRYGRVVYSKFWDTEEEAVVDAAKQHERLIAEEIFWPDSCFYHVNSHGAITGFTPLHRSLAFRRPAKIRRAHSMSDVSETWKWGREGEDGRG